MNANSMCIRFKTAAIKRDHDMIKQSDLAARIHLKPYL